jgi:hypothetical protein
MVIQKGRRAKEKIKRPMTQKEFDQLKKKNFRNVPSEYKANPELYWDMLEVFLNAEELFVEVSVKN